MYNLRQKGVPHVTVRVVTDSCADIAPEVVKELGIAVAPVYVRFGEKVYRDGVDITSDDFYQKLISSIEPTFTSSPSPRINPVSSTGQGTK